MEEKERSNRIKALEGIYKVYEGYVQGLELACKKGCTDCCTSNVTITSLESALLFKSLGQKYAESVVCRIAKNIPKKRFQPKVSLNRYAQICLNGEKSPEEDNDPGWGTCPLLENDICTVYEARPFACRSMFSQKACHETGAAEMSPFDLTVNNVFMQYIEHLDCEGCSGNLSDMILYSGSDAFQDYGRKLIKNQKAGVLMVPPEHQEQIRPLLDEIVRVLP